jgi:hypothetical protein
MRNTDASRDSKAMVKVVLRFYRRLHNHNLAENKDFEYWMWGYYDGMNLSITKARDEYMIDDGHHINGKDLNRIYEIHSLSMYSFEDEVKIKKIMGKNKALPLVVVTQIKLNEAGFILYKDDYSYRLETIIQELQDYLDRSITEFNDKNEYINKEGEKVQYQIYRTLTYSDFVIVFRTDDYQKVAYIVDELRSLRYPYNNRRRKGCLVRFTYSAAGLNSLSARYVAGDAPDISLRLAL